MDNDEKPDMPVTGYDNPSLDADAIDPAIETQVDSALDAAISNSENEPDVSSGETNSELPPEPNPETPQTQIQQPDPAVEEFPAVPEIDPEISAIEQPRNLSEKNQSNWRKLQETATNYKRQAQEAETLKQKLAEYEQRPPQPSDYEELRQFRAMFDIAADPDFQQKYDKPISEAKNNIYAILKKHGAADEVIKSIEAKGGPDKVDQTWWVNNAISKLPFTDAKRLEKNLIDVVELNEKKAEDIQKLSRNPADYYREKNEATVQWFNNQAEEAANYIQTRIKEQNADWAMRKEVPKNATQDQIKAIQSHNAQVDQLESLFSSALFPQTAQQRADVAAAASMSHILTNQLRTEQTARQKLQAQLEYLQKENAKLKNTGRPPKQNGAVAASANRGTTISDRLKMSSADAIDLGLEEAGA